MKSHEIAIQLANEARSADLNEADTRHRIIDRVLHEVFAWPRNRVRCEEFIKPGFADYVLERSDGRRVLFIEAKKESQYFELPKSVVGDKASGYITVKTLLTDASLSAAMLQVRDYCVNVGCELAAVTNGHQWVFFKTFQREEDWRNLKAFVVTSLDYFARHFSQASNNFSYAAITEDGALRRLLLDQALHNRELYYPKGKVVGYEATVDSNRFASSLRPIVDKYFGVIDVDDLVFMESCYVSDREYDAAFVNARRRLEDAITPFLEKYNIQDFKDGGTGGGFARRLQKGVVQAKKSDVIVLFGGKGVGKSTFLRRLLFHKPPQALRKHSSIAYIDLLTDTPDEQSITATVWDQVIDALDEAKLLASDRDQLCRLFQERFEQAKKQDLFGIDESSTEYNSKLNELVREWKKDRKFVAQCLAQHLRRQHKGCIVVIDNTDQFPEALQDFCFSIAQEISSHLNCLSVISMREERFYASSIHGVLDAFQNSGFHITAPQPREVFLRRIRYVRQLLKKYPETGDALPPHLDRDVVDALFRVFENEFSSPSSHLASFLSACSHGNIRLALELFRGFVVSGYTNVQEMTSESRWVLQTHQVIKPFMIPSRHFYDEKTSRIPNLFQIRSIAHGSHFTAMRILALLIQGQDQKNSAFIPIPKIADVFVEIYSMKEDFELNLDMLLRHGLVEANNRLESYSPSVDAVRVTAYGNFMHNALSCSFTYIELVCLDCAIGDQQVSNTITELSNDEYRYFLNHDSIARINVRLQKAETFIAYLEAEEERELDRYSSPIDGRITAKLRTAFSTEKVRVLKSAKRNAKPKPTRLGAAQQKLATEKPSQDVQPRSVDANGK